MENGWNEKTSYSHQMNSNKFLVILFYYNRCKLVEESLRSLLTQDHDNWEVAMVDDGSTVPGIDIVKKIIPDHMHRVSYYRIDDTAEQKIKRKGVDGSQMGMYANYAIEKSNADHAVMLCDDDVLCPGYLNRLNTYYNENPNVHYAYSHIKTYNPSVEVPSNVKEVRPHKLNYTGPMQPYYALDMSQVSFSLQRFKKDGIQFYSPWTVNIDAELFGQMFQKWGLCQFTGFLGQYKAIHDDSLSHRMGQVLGGNKPLESVYNITLT